MGEGRAEGFCGGYFFEANSTASNTKVEIDFSDQFIDNRPKGGIFEIGSGPRGASCNVASDNFCRDPPFRTVINDENRGNSPLDFPST
jgi:hypothetical protein